MRIMHSIARVRLGDHIGLFFREEREYERVIPPIIHAVLERGEKVVVIADNIDNNHMTKILILTEKISDRSPAGDQVEILSAKYAYPDGCEFRPKRILEILEHSISRTLQNGFSGLTITGEMNWYFTGLHGIKRILENDASLYDFFPKSGRTTISRYGMRKYTAEALHSIVETHPLMALSDGTVCNKSHYTQPSFGEEVQVRSESIIDGENIISTGIPDNFNMNSFCHSKSGQVDNHDDISSLLNEPVLSDENCRSFSAIDKGHRLNAGFRELNCLYEISEIIRTKKLSTDQALQKITDTIRKGFQNPRSIFAKIILEDKVFFSGPQQEYSDYMVQKIPGDVGAAMKICVAIVAGGKTPVEKHFLPEKVNLIHEIAYRIGLFIEHRRERERNRQLSAELIKVQDRERKRIACELHDGAGQNLVSAMLYLNFFRHDMKGNGQYYNLAIELLESTDRAIREIASGLYPCSLQHLGLVPSIKACIRRSLEARGIQVEARFDIGTKISSDIELNLYRIVQEAFNNILKHSEAKRVWLDLGLTENHQLVLKVSDDGKGLQATDRHSNCGLGLESIRQRVESMNGKLRIHMKKQTGVSISIRVPVKKDL